MKTIETMTEAMMIVNTIYIRPTLAQYSKAALQSIHEPDPNVVAAVADKLKMDATKVAAVWMLMVEEALK